MVTAQDENVELCHMVGLHIGHEFVVGVDMRKVKMAVDGVRLGLDVRSRSRSAKLRAIARHWVMAVRGWMQAIDFGFDQPF